MFSTFSMRIRFFLGGVAVVTGIVLFVYQVFQSNWMSAVSLLLCGGLVGYSCVFGVLQSYEMPLWKFLASLAGMFGVYSIFFVHPGFDLERVQAHSEALDAFLSIDMNCPIKSQDLNALQQEGTKACALQDHFSMIDAIGEVQKAEVFGPTLSIIDGVRSAAKKPDSDWCVEAYRATKAICPQAFAILSKKAIASLESVK